MNCYNHPSIPAVAVCKNCGKELCPDCLTEVPDGVVCTAGCVDEVNSSNAPVDGGRKLITKSPGTYYGLALLYFVLAITFFCTSYIHTHEKFLGLLASGLFLLASILYVLAALKYKKDK
jgi:hypothetical protein